MTSGLSAGAKPSSSRAALYRWVFCAVVAAVSLAVDLYTKQWAWDTLRAPGGRPIMLWDPTLELAFVLNTGTAFSLVEEIRQPWVMVPLAGLVVAYIVFLTVRLEKPSWWHLVGTGLIVAGAIGNLHDRFVRFDPMGRPGVVDFVKVNFPWGGSWPSFNVADAILVVGVCLVMLGLRGRDAAGSLTS
ncbi:MAG: signal peptidase II [Nannocystaceae bacterium]